MGKLDRDGLKATSSACGAAVSAYKALSTAEAPKALSDVDNLQFDFIKMRLKPRLSGAENAADTQAFVAYQMYAIVKETILDLIAAVPGIWDETSELAVIGGVQINRFGADDLFQPLMFESITKGGKRSDLY